MEVLSFIFDDDVIDDVEDGGEGDDDEPFDIVCAFCDNGGLLYLCEGSCLRLSHATVEDGEETMCESLGLSVDEINGVDFICKNCLHNQHQCFACGELGSSDNESLKAEVFRSSDATCRHFYHPRCIAEWVHGESTAEARDLQQMDCWRGDFYMPVS